MQKQILFVVVIFLSVCVLSTHAVEAHKFRMCKDTGFCKRQRKLSSTPPSTDTSALISSSRSPYKVLADTVIVKGPRIKADMINAQQGVIFTLEFIAYKNEVLRMKINEKQPISKRYEVRDVLLEAKMRENLAPFEQLNKSEALGILTANFGEGNRGKVKIYFSPFKVEVYIDNILSITGNERGLFNFEYLRLKPQPPQPPAQSEPTPTVIEGEGGDKPQEGREETEEGTDKHEHHEPEEKEETPQEPPVEELEGAWEETFSTHPDSKPNGPESVGMDFSFIGSRHVYGIPEHASSLSLKNTRGDGIDSDPYRLYNLDVFEYELDKVMSLYGAVPFMISHDVFKTVGLFWLNPTETFIDIADATDPEGRPRKDTHWFSESGIVDTFFLLGPSPREVFAQFASLTGTGAMPQLFAIAYHQCRWNYKDEADVRTVDAAFDEHNIPYDVLWLDIEHTDGKRYFTWDSVTFPAPTQMQDGIKEKGRKMVVIIDPHIKRDSGYHIYTEAQSKGLYIKNKNNDEYDGWCWPGSSSYLDFTNPATRDWWAEKLSLSDYKGSTPILYVWNDMNEPSVFNGPETSMHKDARHYGDWEHRDVHNIYGYYMHMATSDGLIKRHSEHNDRPFVLSRSFFAGTQRYGAIWTGDNAAQWSHLKASLPMILSLGLGGISFAGADVGGFFGNPDPELLTRWYQAGAYTPFFRGHAHIDTKRREPWLFGEPHTSNIREAIRARYALLPYWYTLFHINNHTGQPLMRPLWVEFPKEGETFGLEDSFMVGSELLVKPVVEAGQSSTSVYLPGKDCSWYDYDTYKQHDGYQTVSVATPIEKLPVFVKGGSVISKKERPRRSSTQMAADPYTLLVALDKKHEAKGLLYVDDGHSFDFISGQYYSVQFTFENNKLQAKTLHDGCKSCQHSAVERVVIVGVNKPKSVVLSNKTELEYEYPQNSVGARFFVSRSMQ